MSAKVISSTDIQKYLDDGYIVVRCQLSVTDDGKAETLKQAQVPDFYIAAQHKVSIQNEMGRQVKNLIGIDLVRCIV